MILSSVIILLLEPEFIGYLGATIDRWITEWQGQQPGANCLGLNSDSTYEKQDPGKVA